MTTARVRGSQLQGMFGSYRAHEDLQAAVLTYLGLRGLPAIPITTGPRVRPAADGRFELRSNAAQRGMADVLSCVPPHGRLLLIECKTGRARRSPAQVRMHARFSAAGGLCVVVRNALELEPIVGPSATQGGRA